jgi:hypothetical protein
MMNANGDLEPPQVQAPLICLLLKRLCCGTGRWFCPHVRAHRLYFYLMVVLLVSSMFCFGGAASLARQYDYERRWHGFESALPLLVSLFGHWAFWDYRVDEDHNMLYASNRSNFEKSTARVGIALAISMLVVGGALYVNAKYWWCEAKMGKPDAASTGGDDSALPPLSNDTDQQQQQQTTLSQWLTSKTPTPSHTPSHTPTPSMSAEAAAEYRDTDESERSFIGLVYFASALCAVASIWCNYQYRVVRTLGADSDQ